MHRRTPAALRLLLVPALALAGCSVGPDYRKPDAAQEAPPAWKEEGPWKEAAPRDAIAKGDWWTVFGDPVLDGLEKEAAAANQNLRAAVARVVEARAAARVAAADFFPNITLDPAAQESHSSQNRLLPPGSGQVGYTGSTFQVPVDLSYEVDIWGRVRRSFEAYGAEAQATVADYETVLLTLKSDVAQNYFSLRALDTELILLVQTVELRKKARDLAKVRFQGGASSELDLAQAETELASVEAQAASVEANRAKMEHALAVLVGKPPAAFSIAARPLDAKAVPPAIPPGLPSELLERRPDVAAAERRMAEANAKIGVAKAAFFPVVRITGDAGFESKDIGNLLTWGSRSWGIGPSVSIPLFEGGALAANLREAKAAYEEAAARYRQQVLVSFGDVEDGLSGLRILAKQAEAQDRAVASAARADEIAQAQYKSGLVNYLQIVDTERTLLDNQRSAAQLLGQRFVTTVLLVKALGGGWADVVPAAQADRTPQ
ncbi:MAG TPA: efflux transporter outer membrane subunit [Candidatus Methylacidiphilales bacterium]